MLLLSFRFLRHFHLLSFARLSFASPCSNSLKMFSRISVTTLTLLVTLAGIGYSAPLDVYTPPLVTPAAGEVWQVGTRQKVTWWVFYLVKHGWRIHCWFFAVPGILRLRPSKSRTAPVLFSSRRTELCWTTVRGILYNLEESLFSHETGIQ